MKFFIDTAMTDEIREAQAMGVIDGVTTNPTLAAQAGFVEGEEIIMVNNIKTMTWSETIETILSSAMDAEQGIPVSV